MSDNIAPDSEDGIAAGLGRLDRRDFLIRMGMGAASLMLSSTLLALPTPVQARGFFPMPSVDDQKTVGRQAAQQILAKYPEVHDARADAFRQMGQRLVAALPPDDRKWNFDFHVLDSKDVNAFAVPGGPMFMFTGLYNIIPTMDALAAVTGHEMTHVRKQHWAKAYQKQQSRDFFISLGLALSHAGTAVQDLAGMADSALSLKYSRGEEDQADEGGLQNMVSAGFNPQGMIQLFQVLQKVSGNGGGLGGAFLSDHPLTSDRIKNAKSRIAALGDRHFPALTPLVGSGASPIARRG